MRIISISENWQLEGLKDDSRVPLTIPGDTFSALYEAGLIPDPYYDRNELEVQWVSRKDWTFRTDFEVEPAFLSDPHLFLELGPVDTFSDILLNGIHIGTTDNMFKLYRLLVSHALKAGSNTLEIRFTSAEVKAEELQQSLPYPVPHTEYPVQSMGRNLVRKAQCHAGWDWGPCLMVSGLYGPVSLKSSPLERIEAVHSTVSLQNSEANLWNIEVLIDIYSIAGGQTQISADCAGTSQQRSILL